MKSLYQKQAKDAATHQPFYAWFVYNRLRHGNAFKVQNIVRDIKFNLWVGCFYPGNVSIVTYIWTF